MTNPAQEQHAATNPPPHSLLPWQQWLFSSLQTLVEDLNPPGLHRVLRRVGPWLFQHPPYQVSYRGRFDFIYHPGTAFNLLVGFGLIHQDMKTILTRLITNMNDPIVFFDIGANEGFVSLLACSWAQQVGKTIQAHTFEPNPFAQAVLGHNIALNPFDIRVNPVAVGAAHGQQTMQFTTESINSTLHASSLQATLDAREVDIITLDAYCHQQGLTPQIIKIDVEGYEPEVLQGARQTLTEGRPYLLLEINHKMLQRGGNDSASLLHQLRAYHYDLYYIDAKIARIVKPQGSQTPAWHGHPPVETGDQHEHILWDALAIPR